MERHVLTASFHQQYWKAAQNKGVLSMPKKIFWPVSLVVMGFVFLASNMGFLPTRFWNLWPIILIVVGLGGLLTSDREEWLTELKKPSSRKIHKKPAKKAASRKRR